MPVKPAHNPYIAILLRELKRITARPIYLIAALLLPLFAIFFMATIFNTGNMEDLPIGIVDMDNTSTSRSVIRTVTSTPTVTVTQHYANQQEAHHAVQRKEIYAYVVIPDKFEQKVNNNQATTLDYYYHYALLSVGGEIEGALETVLNTVAASPYAATAMAHAIPSEEITNFVLPTSLQIHGIYNPDLNYAVYLSQPLFFIIFQILVMLVTLYSVGGEVKFGTAEEWLATADGSMTIALAGKLTPYSIIFVLLTIFSNYVFFGLIEIPYSGNFWQINLISILFILATQGFTLIVFMVFPAMSYSISIISMLGSLGATLSGVTFPLGAMYKFFEYASYLLPVHYFTEIVQTVLYNGYSLIFEWKSIAILFVYIMIPLIMIPRFKKSVYSHKYDNLE